MTLNIIRINLILSDYCSLDSSALSYNRFFVKAQTPSLPNND